MLKCLGTAIFDSGVTTVHPRLWSSNREEMTALELAPAVEAVLGGVVTLSIGALKLKIVPKLRRYHLDSSYKANSLPKVESCESEKLCPFPLFPNTTRLQK